MAREFKSGDVLIFQLESGYGLLKVLAIDELENGESIWHLAAYADLFLDAEMADAALANPENMSYTEPHLALTNRAFEATQTSRMTNLPLTDAEIAPVRNWRENPNRRVSDASIRLLLGLR